MKPPPSCIDCGKEKSRTGIRCRPCSRPIKVNYCSDCGIEISRGRAVRCEPCSYKFMTNPPKRCVDCEETISITSVRCKPCLWKSMASPVGARRTNSEGYVFIKTEEFGWIKEHRYVMSLHIGRPLTKNEEVHHLNGVRDDNRIENLELWSTSQPKGQRVVDKLEWAREIIEQYEKIEELINN